MLNRHHRTLSGLGILTAALGIAAMATAQTAGPNEPVLTGSFGWEDGNSTIFGSNEPDNVTAVNDDTFSRTGSHSLRITEAPHASTAVHVYLGHIRNLEHGDIVRASFWAYDDTPPAHPRMRIWGHFTSGESVEPVAQAGGNNAYTQGVGWEELSHEWTFNAFQGQCGGNCDGMVVQVRLYNDDQGCATCSTDYWVDDLSIEVYCASNPNLAINFTDGSSMADPLLPGNPCEPSDEPIDCDTNWVTSSYSWADGEASMIGTNVPNNLTAVNQSDFVRTGPNALRVTEAPHTSTTPQIWLAQVRNLTDGDVVTGSFWTYDEFPGTTPRVRIWAHYTSGSGLTSVSPAFSGSEQNETYSAGIGWEEITNTWTFNSNNGARDGILIHARIFSGTCNPDHPHYDPDTGQCSTDYFFDDISVEVCASNPQNVQVLFPIDFLTDPKPPVEMCKEPALVGSYGWEDGKATHIGVDSDSVDFITTANTSEFVHSGARALKITESPNAPGTPEIHIAFIENLQTGDLVRARFTAYDDTPGASPSVRIWGRYARSGQPDLHLQSAGGNLTFTSGTGWEEIEHIWEFDAGSGPDPRTALLVHVRVYAPACNPDNPTWDPKTETCSTDFFVDDLVVEVCSDQPNAAITFPDGTVIGDPGAPTGCPADVDGSGDIDLFDLFAVLGAWGTADQDADVNNDGLVDGADAGIVLASFGSCADFLFPMPGAAQLVLEDSPAGGSMRQYDLYVQLDASESIVNVYDGAVTSSLGFGGGSFITIGSTSQHFDIVEDPNFDFTGFSSGTSLGVNAGWYNFDPSNNLGLADLYPNNRVLIARFFVNEATDFDAAVSVTYEDADGRARQVSLNLGPDVPDCPADLTGSGSVGVPDLLALLACWGPVSGNCTNADLTGNGSVGVPDLLALLAQWGPCPQ